MVNNEEFHIGEMIFGVKDEFIYFECSKCGCLQIAEIPSNMEKYYPQNLYYSFQKGYSNNFIKKVLKRKRDEYAIFKKGFIGKIVYKKYPDILLDMISKTKISHNSRILDVGCGSGNLLYSLNEIGFKDLVSIDPFIDNEIKEKNIEIFKKTIHEISDIEKFDLVIFNHSFEHIPDQLETLLKVCKILSNSGICLIRMPIKTEYIWNRYGINWVQIDAPRHFFIHTLRSFKLLTENSGLTIQEVIFDSTEFQFWGSEQYKRGIPLNSENSYSVNPEKSIFTAKQIKEFKKMAKELNKNKQGDQAAFYLGRERK